jgi:hypothetical protein
VPDTLVGGSGGIANLDRDLRQSAPRRPMRIPATATLAGFSSRAAAHDGKSRVLDPEPLHRWLFCSPDSGVRPGLLAVSGLAVPSWPMADAALSLAGLLPLDLLHYLVHRLEHAVPFFWRIHAPHHSDPDVDVTTARRFGITRSRSSSPRPPIGSPCRARYPRLRCAEPRPRGFHHGCCPARQCSPPQLERYLQPMLVTTDLHRVHHSVSFDLASCTCPKFG